MLGAEKRQVKYLDALTIAGWTRAHRQNDTEAIAISTQWDSAFSIQALQNGVTCDDLSPVPANKARK